MPSIPDENLAPPSDRECSQSKCKAKLPVGYKFKSCEKCREVSRLGMQKKRKREKEDEGHQRQAVLQPSTVVNSPVERSTEATYIEESTSDEGEVSHPY
jgi:hypothetical protein